MVQNLELNKMGLTPMTNNEMIEIDGGGFWANFIAIGGAIVGVLIAGPVGAALGGVLGGIIGTMVDNN